jgi:hypothetical protein
VTTPSGAKQNSYCTAYNITLNSNCEAHTAFKIFLKLVRIQLAAKINAQVI